MRCEKCGFDFDAELGRCPKCNASVEFSGNTMFYRKAAESHVKFREIFSGTFRKHPSGTAAKIFAAGSPETTPTSDKMLAVWQKPWLYSRFLIAGLLFLVVGYALAVFLNPGLLAVLGSFGALITPFAVLMFIWEMNIPRDISFIKVLAFFVFGGMMSLVFILIIGFALEDGYEAPFAAFVEEPAKLLITLILMHKAKVKYGFGGMLIGASVGAGFAVFETIAYVFNNYIEWGLEEGRFTFIIRSLLAIGGHVTWAAIAGAGAALGRKGKAKGFGYLTSPIFYGCVIADIILHFTWNGGLEYFFDMEEGGQLAVILLDCVIAIAILFVLTNLCLKQVVKAYNDARTDVLNRAPDPNVNASVRTPEVPAFAGNREATSASFANTVVQTQKAVKTYTLRSDFLKIKQPINKVLNIGRDPSCTIVFPADTAGVSRKHCAVMTSEDGVVYVMDLGSSVGTFLMNGKKLAPNEWAPVSDAFYVATEKYTFTIE